MSKKSTKKLKKITLKDEECIRYSSQEKVPDSAIHWIKNPEICKERVEEFLEYEKKAFDERNYPLALRYLEDVIQYARHTSKIDKKKYVNKIRKELLRLNKAEIPLDDRNFVYRYSVTATKMLDDLARDLSPFTQIMRNVIERKFEEQNDFYKKFTTITSLGVIILGLFFLSQNITGNTILNINKISSNWIGIILFGLGIIGVFFNFKKK